MSVKIIQGDDVEFDVLVQLNGQPYDLSGVTAATFKIPTDSGCLDLTLGAGLTIPTPTNGKVKVEATDAQTPTLKKSKLNVELILEEGTKTRTLQFKNGVEVIARFC